MFLGLTPKTLTALGASALLVIVGATSAVVMASGDDFASVDAPRWEAGYAFAYDVSGTVEYLVEVPGELSDRDGFSFGPVPVEKEILSTQFDHGGKPLYVGAATFPLGHFLAEGARFEFPDLAVYPTADRQRDLAPVGVTVDDEDLAFGPDAPITYLDFPLTHGKRWSSEMHVSDLFGEADLLEGTEYVDLDRVLVQGEVGAMETLRLTIGDQQVDVDAVRVDISYSPIGLQKAVAQARADAEKFGADIERLNVQLGVHEIAWYAPEYQAIVRDQFVVRALVDAAGSFQGDRYEVYTEATGTALAEMTGARLLKGAEKDTPEILRILRGEAPIADAHGEDVPETVYDVVVESSHARVNAADAPVVTFTSDLVGVPELPDGHALRYQFVDADGHVLDAGAAGASWSVTVDEPGSHTLLLQGVDADGRVYAQDAVSLAADWVQTVDASCPVVTGRDFMPCDEVSVPVSAGIQSLSVTAYRNGTSFMESGRLVVDAPHESYTAGRGSDGVYRVTVTEFAPDTLTGDWEAYYDSLGGVGERVTYVLELRFGAVEAVEPTFETEAGVGGALVTRDAGVLADFGSPLGAFLEQMRRGEAPTLAGELESLLP